MRLRFDAQARAILRRVPVVNVYSIAELVLLTGLAVQCARLTWAIATPVAPLGDWRPAEPAAAQSGDAGLSGFDPFFRSAAAGPQAVTSLNVKLFGIRVDEAMGRGSAIVAGADGVQKSVSVGEEVAPGVTLRTVAFDHVTLDRGGASEDLFLDQSGGAPAAAAPGTPPAGGSLLGSPPGGGGGGAAGEGGSGGVTPQQLSSDIGFVPRIDGGRVSGLTVRQQGGGAAFRAAGLRDGDVVTALGGRPVSGQGDLERIARDYADGGRVPITVERGGRTLPLSVAVSPR